MKKNNITISLKSDILAKLIDRSTQKGFGSVEHYIEDILIQITKKIEQNNKVRENSSEEEEKVKRKLKELGYL